MKPSAWIGAWIGAVLTMALVAVGYLQWRLFGLPFAPFDLFDALTRAVPGAVVTFGIESIVIVSRTLNVASTGAAAKLAEQAMAIGVMLGAGVLVAALAFSVLRLSDESALLFGLVLGSTWGMAAVLVARRLNRIAPGRTIVSGSSLFAEFLLWGLALGWSNDRLRERYEPPTADGAPARVGLARRQFLFRLSAGMAAIAGAATTFGTLARTVRKSVGAILWSDTHVLPNAEASVAPVVGTRPEFTALADHYRIDVDTEPPIVDGRLWRLRIGGLIDKTLELTLDDLARYEPMHQFITLSCISNPVGGDLIGTTRWTGVSLQRLLPRLRLTPRATHLKIASADGFSEVVALETVLADERVMLTYAWDGVSLPIEHGFPLRLYVPDVYGMKQPKWIQTIEAIDHWEPGYWVARGWDRQGHVNATSAIDAVGRIARDGTRRDGVVSLGGIAYAGARRISRVEVRVGDGEWHKARLREPLSDTTWVVWRAELMLPAEAVLTVRCYDGSGVPQTSAWDAARVSPDGRIVRQRPVELT